MIYTVTLNPAFDITVYTKELIKGTLNRSDYYLIEAAGKGVNVSKVIKALGGDSIALGFLGDENKELFLKYLSIDGIKSDFIMVKGQTRTNIKIIETKHNVYTEINQKGFEISKSNMEEFFKKIEDYAHQDDIFILSGSLPQNIDDDIYQHLIYILKNKGAMTILDADKNALKNGIKAHPDIIKPNIFELKTLFDMDENNLDSIIEAARKLVALGIKKVIVSRGAQGALFATESDIYIAHPYEVAVKSTVGAGDAMVAAAAYGSEKKLDDLSIFKLSCAAATASILKEGARPPTKEMIENLFENIKVEKIG